jgi:ureidoglycolate dehydrogenase (NAD+)
MNEVYLDHNTVLEWSVAAFSAIGLDSNDAHTIASSLVETSLWGIDSHGVARITHYLTRIQNGTIKAAPSLNFEQTGLATARLDGDHGHGMVIMNQASDKVIQLAGAAGVGVVGVFNSSHCGAIGLYTRKIANAGMVGFAFTHADALVVPAGGKRPFFGTNPISIAFPTMNVDEPVCLDMATSIVPWNFMMNAKREKKSVPLGLGVDKDGNDSEDSESIVAVKPMADYKGYALAFMIDLLCGPLNQMNFGPNMTSMYKDLGKQRRLGSLVIAIDPEKFGGLAHVRLAATSMINQVKTHGDNVLFPGEPEYIKKKIRMEQGLPFTETLIADFNNWAKRLGIVPLT